MAATPGDILQFWYGDPPFERREEWFHGGPAFDDECRRFQPDWEIAHAGGLEDWLDERKSLLAYVILTDQIPRNIFRDDARTHATDAKALNASKKAVALGWNTEMEAVERQFLYLPYEHSEDLAAQRICLQLMAEPGLEHILAYAQAHYDIVKRFGRFPHRNAMLGRVSTPAELAFIAEKGRGF